MNSNVQEWLDVLPRRIHDFEDHFTKQLALHLVPIGCEKADSMDLKGYEFNKKCDLLPKGAKCESITLSMTGGYAFV